MMNFYELTYPQYASDQAERKNNPVKLIPNISIPAIVCDDCGLWSSSKRIRRNVELTSKSKEILNNKNIHADDWNSSMRVLSEELKIDIESLKPGAELGMPRGIIANVEMPHFVHPFTGVIWITDSVKDVLTENMATGVEFCEVDIELKKGKVKSEQTLPRLWEIVVLGKAWRKGFNYENSIACKKCGRTKFLDPDFLKIDESTWDQSDFFLVDLNPNIIVVTERICELFKKNNFNNYQCKKI